MHEKLKASIMQSPVIDRNGYPYLVHPVTDGVPKMEPEIMDEIIDWMASVCDLDCDRILAPEAMGIPLAVPLSMRTGIPYTILRKRQYGLDGEIMVSYKTGYSDRVIYINGLSKGDRVVIVDDMVSMGGTLSAIIGALRENGIVVKDVMVVFNKGGDIEEINRRLGIVVKRMLDVSLEDRKAVIAEPLG